MKVVKWLIVLIVLASLGWFVYTSDLDAIIANINQVGWGFVWIIVITTITQVFGTLSWQSTLPKDLDISFKDLFFIRYIGDQIGMINPTNFVGGDALKAYQLEKYQVKYSDSISSLIVSRAIYIYVQVALFLVAAIIYLFWSVPENAHLIRLIFLSIGFLGIVGFLAFKSGRLLDLKWLRASKYQDRLMKVRSTISSYYKNETQRFLMANFWAAITFIFGALEIWAICQFIHIDISYLASLLIDQGVLFLKSFGAFVPGQIGVEEYSNKLMLGVVGVTSTSVWLSVSILRRARQLFWLLLCLPIYYLMMKPAEIKLSSAA